MTDEIRALLAADTALLAIVTGGAYTFAGLGRLGIGRAGTPNAYGTDGYLRPLLVVQAGETETVEGENGALTPITVTVYNDGDQGAASVRSAAARVRVLLDGAWIAGAGRITWRGEQLDQRDPKLNNVIAGVMTFACRAPSGVSGELRLAAGHGSTIGLTAIGALLAGSFQDYSADPPAEWRESEGRFITGDRRLKPIGRAWAAWRLWRLSVTEMNHLRATFCAGELEGLVTVRTREGAGAYRAFNATLRLLPGAWVGGAWHETRLEFHDLQPL